jgi:hypothetical protein
MHDICEPIATHDCEAWTLTISSARQQIQIIDDAQIDSAVILLAGAEVIANAENCVHSRQETDSRPHRKS